MRRGAAVARSAGRTNKELGDVARLDEQRAALHRKWASLQVEANAKLAALHGSAGGGVAISRVQIGPRKADTDVGILTLVWLPFRRDSAGNSSYAFSLT